MEMKNWFPPQRNPFANGKNCHVHWILNFNPKLRGFHSSLKQSFSDLSFILKFMYLSQNQVMQLWYKIFFFTLFSKDPVSKFLMSEITNFEEWND